MIIVKDEITQYYDQKNIKNLHIATMIDCPGVIMIGLDNTILDHIETRNNRVICQLYSEIRKKAMDPNEISNVYEITQNHILKAVG